MSQSYRCPLCGNTHLEKGIIKNIKICDPCRGLIGELNCVRCANNDLKAGKTSQHKECERCGLKFQILEQREGYFKFKILRYKTGWNRGSAKGFKLPGREELHYGR